MANWSQFQAPAMVIATLYSCSSKCLHTAEESSQHNAGQWLTASLGATVDLNSRASFPVLSSRKPKPGGSLAWGGEWGMGRAGE